MRRATRNTVKSTETAAAPFDLSKVKTTADAPMRKGERIFGLQEAPTYYPTKEEFQDPLAYIAKISPEGEKYGIIKIVPPKDYHPEFSLKTENFRFRTRIQKLNSMEGETRTNVNYLEQLTKYHIQNGKSVSKIPQLDKRPIDLYKLKNEVALRGGVQEVTRLKKWAEIGRILGYTRKQCTSLSNSLKTAYINWVLPYEIWYAKHKDDVDKVLKNQNTMNNNDDTDICEICQKIENQDKLLLCDGCNRGYHLYCLKPPFTEVPKNDWYCLQCLTAVGKDYGFEDGDEYSLEEFRQFSNKFKKEWFRKLLGDNHKEQVTEEMCENEFWRLVEDPHEKCQVEYGADLHSTQHGSGFMAAEQMPRGAFDPWNLNVIPVAPQSLFTHIKTDISGMMVPWLYIGMCFSAFCWHNEDHYTFSINYMHWGETKTWYGVPGSDTAQFEETMKKAVPELFEQQPDLLFQLVTMLSPGRLLQENVHVYAVDQRPGQFVVTYPKAYHSGFNHGFNFCEAVNFAPGNWVDHGLECVKLYKAFRKQPCFSHDELLTTAAHHLKSSENIEWLQRGLAEMQTRELNDRKKVRSRKLREERMVSEDEELQCEYCHCYTYLSSIGCNQCNRVACHDHISELCSCDISAKTLYLRFTDQELKQLTNKVNVSHSERSEQWIQKVDTAMAETSSTPMKVLKDLLKEGRTMNAPQDALDTLKDYIEAVEQWNIEAERVLHLKQHDYTKKTKRYLKVKELIERASSIGFEPDCLGDLKSYQVNLEILDSKLTDDLLTSHNKEVQMQLYKRGMELCSDTPRFLKLRALLESPSWEERSKAALEQPYDSKVLRQLIKEGEEMGMPLLLEKLIQTEAFGKKVLYRVDNICRGREKLELEGIEEDEKNHFSRLGQEGDLAIVLGAHTVARLHHHVERSREMHKEIEEAMKQKSSLSVAEGQQLMNMCRELSFKSPLAQTISSELNKASAWTEQMRRTWMSGRQKSLDSVLKAVLSNVTRITTTADDEPDTWCICRRPESGLMIECDECREWYHTTCVKVTRSGSSSSRSATNVGSYSCPICDPSSSSSSDEKISHASRQPSIEEITELVEKGRDLRFYPKEYEAMCDIHAMMSEYRDKVQAFCRSRAQLQIEDIDKIKHYLRTLTGLEVCLRDEKDFLKSKMQTLSTSPKQVIACVCKNTENKQGLIVCSECQRWSHSACVKQPNPLFNGKEFICTGCCDSKKKKKKRAASEMAPSSKPPQKIIKLTVRPPSSHSNKRQRNSKGEEEQESSYKKQKSTA